MKYILIITILVCPWIISAGAAQLLTGKDTVLLRERTLDRPLNVHGGQLRITGGYGINLHNHAFDASGAKINLVKDGLSSLRHQGVLDIRYGLSEYLQLSLLYGYFNETIMERTILLYGYPAGIIGSEINESSTYKGADDLNVQIDFRIPFRTHKFDLLIQAGSELPTGPTRLYSPENTIGLDASGQVQQIRYNYRYATGKGVVTPYVGAVWKHRLGSIAYTLFGNFRHSLDPTTVNRWETYLDNGNLTSATVSSTRTLPDEVRIGGEFEMQLSPLFNVSLQAQYRHQSNGWETSPEGNFALSGTNLLQAGIGYELIVTPRLWLKQRLLLPFNGMSIRAGTILQSSLSYNVFVVK